MTTLLKQLKEALNITWNDSDEALTNCLNRGEDFLKSLSGTEPDFNKGLANVLLLNYARYDFNNAAEYFEENFKSEILRFQFEEAVK